jgi:hypothetical protein
MSAFLHKAIIYGALAVWAAAPGARAQEPQRLNARPILGNEATPFLRFDSSDPYTNALRQVVPVTNVQISGTWNAWRVPVPLAPAGENLWELDVRTLDARLGRQEFKFIVNGEWEGGDNRVLPINLAGEIERQPAMIQRATIDDFKLIRVFFRQSLPAGIAPTATLDPPVPVVWTEVVTEMEDARRTGYLFSQGVVTFLFDPAVYGLELPRETKVAVAGNFTGWDGGGGGGKWELKRGRLPGTWEGTAQLGGMRLPPGEKELVFKFVLNGTEWLSPPEGAPNALPDGKGSVNLKLDLLRTGGAEIRVHLAEPLDLTEAYVLRLDGVATSPGRDDHPGRRVRQDRLRQAAGRDPGQGTRHDDIPDLRAARAQRVAVLLRPADGGDLDAELQALSADGRIPDVEGSGGRRLGDHHARAGRGPLLRLPRGRAAGRRGKLQPGHGGGRSVLRAARERAGVDPIDPDARTRVQGWTTTPGKRRPARRGD